jgi:hypothetical protein
MITNSELVKIGSNEGNINAMNILTMRRMPRTVLGGVLAGGAVPLLRIRPCQSPKGYPRWSLPHQKYYANEGEAYGT